MFRPCLARAAPFYTYPQPKAPVEYPALQCGLSSWVGQYQCCGAGATMFYSCLDRAAPFYTYLLCRSRNLRLRIRLCNVEASHGWFSISVAETEPQCLGLVQTEPHHFILTYVAVAETSSCVSGSAMWELLMGWLVSVLRSRSRNFSELQTPCMRLFQSLSHPLLL